MTGCFLCKYPIFYFFFVFNKRHPISNMMQTALENIKDMVDVNTVIGDAIETGDGNTIIPVSRVCFGFVAGGGEYGSQDAHRLVTDNAQDNALPFAGGSGAGVSGTCKNSILQNYKKSSFSKSRACNTITFENPQSKNNRLNKLASVYPDNAV